MSSSQSSLLSVLIVHACAGTSTIHLAELQLQSALATAKAAARAAGQAAACCGVSSSRVREAVRKLPASLQGCVSQETATPPISQVRDVQLSEGSLCSLLCSGKGGSAVSLLSELQTNIYHDSSAKPHAALSPRLCPSPGCRQVSSVHVPKAQFCAGKGCTAAQPSQPYTARPGTAQTAGCSHSACLGPVAPPAINTVTTGAGGPA